MPSFQSVAKAEREKKLQVVLAFSEKLIRRADIGGDATLSSDLEAQIRALPLQPSSTVLAKQNELDRLGTELWNMATRLRHDEIDNHNRPVHPNAHSKRTIPLLRVFSFLLLDSAGGHGNEDRQHKNCIRLIKVALKTAKVCIQSNELSTATKVLERAADYEDVLSREHKGKCKEEIELIQGLRIQYFAVRTTLAWRHDRMDTAEHMFAKCKQLVTSSTHDTAEILADMLYEIGQGSVAKRDYNLASRWLERAHDILEGHDPVVLSPEAGELKLCILQAIVQAYTKINTPETLDKAWQMMKLMETDFGDKMVFFLLKLELLAEAERVDSAELYNVLLRMIRTIVLNETNFKTIMHHIHKLNAHKYKPFVSMYVQSLTQRSNATAIQALDDLMDVRLFREENQQWIEKVIVTRIWIGSTNGFSESTLEQLQDLFDNVSRNLSAPLSGFATHAAQTMLWKNVESAASQEQHKMAEAWCHLCLHPIFEKAGSQNKAKVSRKIIQCALSRQDYEAARSAHSQMTESSRDEPVTRYLMYKVALQSRDAGFAAECLDCICRSSAKDATLLYACVLEAQNAGSKRQAINALQKVLDRYEYSAPSGIHLPALLRSTTRMLQSELIKDGNIDALIMDQLCATVEGACNRAKASRTRPSTPAKELFTPVEFEWFSKNTYNLSLKHCAEMSPKHLLRLLNCCMEFIKLLKEKDGSNTNNNLCLRLVFCEFLAASTCIVLARAEDNVEQHVQYYLEARKHSQNFRRVTSEMIHELAEPTKADITSKHLHIVKLELEAVLKLQKWDELDELFDQCWKYKSPDHYETLADLVLVIHGCLVQAEVDIKYQKKVLSVLQKIVNMVSRQPDSDVPKLSRWLRCLFSLSLPFDDDVSLKCIEQAIYIAATKQHDHERYPKLELEWLATTTFNRAVDYYVQEDDENSKKWAEKAFVIAQWVDDDGATRDFLMKRFSILKFSEQETARAG